MTAFTLNDLSALIEERANSIAGKSYTRTLLDSGVPRIAKKVGEEAVETIIAAVEGDRAQVVVEAADLLYHLMVLLHASNLSIDQVVTELGRRTHQSGLDEKTSRP